MSGSPARTGRYGVLYPAIAEAARRAGADAIGLIDVLCADGQNLAVDRAGIRYDNGQVLGDARSEVQHSCTLVGHRPVPTRAIPRVVTRIGLDRRPGDLVDPGSAWELLRGDPLALLPAALGRVPPGALPVITTTWALSRFSRARRESFADLLAGAGRTLAWVSVEGVGVAPGVPTLGDRPASGHSLVGVAVGEADAEVVARCWSRGRLLAWLAAT